MKVFINIESVPKEVQKKSFQMNKIFNNLVISGVDFGKGLQGIRLIKDHTILDTVALICFPKEGFEYQQKKVKELAEDIKDFQWSFATSFNIDIGDEKVAKKFICTTAAFYAVYHVLDVIARNKEHFGLSALDECDWSNFDALNWFITCVINPLDLNYYKNCCGVPAYLDCKC